MTQQTLCRLLYGNLGFVAAGLQLRSAVLPPLAFDEPGPLDLIGRTHRRCAQCAVTM